MSQQSLPQNPTDLVARLRFGMAALGDISSLLTSEGEEGRVEKAALRAALGTVSASRGALLVYEKNSGQMRCVAHQGLRRSPDRFAVAPGLIKSLLDSEQPLTTTAPRPAVLEAHKAFLYRLQARYWIPLRIGPDLEGVLSVGPRYRNKPYGLQDEQFMRICGYQLALVLYHRRLANQNQEANDGLNRHIYQLENLHQASLGLGETLELDKVMELVGDLFFLAITMVDARCGFLFLRDEKTRRYTLAYNQGFDDDQLVRLKAPRQLARLRRVMGQGGPLRLEAGPLGDHPMLLVPLGGEGFLGVVNKEFRHGIGSFTEADGNLLELMGKQAGLALANARNFRDLTAERNLTRNIFSSVENGLITTDLQGSIVQVNPAAAKIFPAEGSLIGRSCPWLLHRYGLGGIAADVESTLADGEPRYRPDIQAQQYQFTLNVRITARRDEQNAVQGVVLVLEDLTERERLSALFKQYANEQVVDLLLQDDNPPALGGQRHDVSVLFVDLTGSTDLLLKIGPEEMVECLNNCFAPLVDCVQARAGILTQYTGDGFMAVFGAPLPLPDGTERATRAVTCALAIRQEMERYNRDNPLRFDLKIGISQGKVVAGNIGSLRRMDYTVIGPCVVLASRLCDHARREQILADASIYESLKDRYVFNQLRRQSFKNIPEYHEVYQILGELGTVQPPDRTEEIRPVKKQPEKIDLTMPLQPDIELMAAHSAAGVGEFMGLDQDKIDEVKMALIEACINAVEHSKSKDGRLTIDFTIATDRLTIVISDRGHGFDRDNVDKQIRSRRAQGERRGWGLKLMEELMDDVKIDSDKTGTTITMVKNR
ncbi:MAG: PAS domain S-box protein [Candidatus Latescibacteria bacterium]|nr:PAS domain S-box protein [Candidatus Latescibacterota bacterium]